MTYEDKRKYTKSWTRWSHLMSSEQQHSRKGKKTNLVVLLNLYALCLVFSYIYFNKTQLWDNSSQPFPTATTARASEWTTGKLNRQDICERESGVSLAKDDFKIRRKTNRVTETFHSMAFSDLDGRPAGFTISKVANTTRLKVCFLN